MGVLVITNQYSKKWNTSNKDYKGIFFPKLSRFLYKNNTIDITNFT